MIKIIEFHVGKNDPNLRGVWTHDPHERKKFIPLMGLEPVTSRFEEQNTTIELWRVVTKMCFKKLTNEYTYDTVLAIFSQFAPLCANFHLYSTNLDLFPPLFS